MAFIDGYNAKTNRMAVQAQADAQKADLFAKGYTVGNDGQVSIRDNSQASVQEEQNKQMMQLAQGLQNKLSAQDTDKAIGDFITSGDATFLQRALDNNEQLKSVWGNQGVQLIQNIDFGNDGKLLGNMGVKPEHYDTPEKQDALRKNLYKYYDGKDYQLGAINNLVAETGASRRLNQQQMDLLFDHNRMLQNVLRGTTNQNEDTKVAVEVQNAETNAKNADTNRFAAQANAANAAADNANKRAELGLRAQEFQYKREYGDMTSEQKNLMAADRMTENLLKDFGASREDSSAFFNTDFSKRENFEKGYRYISKIEQLEGVNYTEADKSNIRDMRQLISLADPASKISGADTGLIDKKLGDVKAYLDDNVKGAKAKAAYTTFRNIMRRNMSGQALTDSEIKANTEAMGQLGEQLGPTLAKFQTSLLQVKSQVDGYKTMMNPYSAQVRLGADQKKLDGIINNIDKTLTYLQGAEGAAAARQDTGIREQPSDRKPLSSFFTYGNEK